MKLLVVAACALVDRDGRVLVAQRPAGKAWAGLWEFPGGKVEPGESPEQAVVREMWEELRVEPCLECLHPFAFASHRSDEGAHLLMPLFVARQWDGLPQPTEHQAIAWRRPAELTSLEMPPADKPLAAELRDRL